MAVHENVVKKNRAKKLEMKPWKSTINATHAPFFIAMQCNKMKIKAKYNHKTTLICLITVACWVKLLNTIL